MGTCDACGAPLPPVGRFCVNCGTRVPDAGRGAPAAGAATGPDPAPPPERTSAAGDEAPRTGQADDPFWLLADAPGEPEREPVALPVLGIVIALVLVAVTGAFLLTRDGGRADPGTDRPGAGASVTRGTGSGGSGGNGRQLRRRATVEVPATAPPGTDVGGGTITFEGELMLDGRRGTAWRMAGDGTGEVITITFRREVVLTRVGLVNGYAKRVRTGDRRVDWYAANRRIRRVRWAFDDGRPVRQRLEETLDMQTRDLRRRTKTVRLRLAKVSRPGRGPDSRDYTAISDISLVGWFVGS